MEEPASMENDKTVEIRSTGKFIVGWKTKKKKMPRTTFLYVQISA